MAYNFLRGDRDQPFLLPPDLRDWLPQGHLAWFILDVVDQLDLEVAEILKQAAKADQREDRLFGDARGDELPAALASKADRLARLRQAKAQLEAEAAERAQRFAERVAASTTAAQAESKAVAHPQAPGTGRGAQSQGDRQRHRP